MEEDLKRLGKQELIDIIESLYTEIDNLRADNRELRAQLNSRELKMEKCGSIAEAAMSMNDIFSRAQMAADVYLENIKRLERETAGRCAVKEKEAELRAEKIIGSAEKQCDELMQAAVTHANEALNRAASICAEKLGEAEAVLKSAHRDSADIRDAALRFFMERSTNAPLHLQGKSDEPEELIPDVTVEESAPAEETAEENNE